MFYNFCSFESRTLLPNLKRLQLCLLWEEMPTQGTWNRPWPLTHLSQHEVHLSWAHQPGLKCYGPESLLIGLEIVVSLKTILWYHKSISVIIQATWLFQSKLCLIFNTAGCLWPTMWFHNRWEEVNLHRQFYNNKRGVSGAWIWFFCTIWRNRMSKRIVIHLLYSLIEMWSVCTASTKAIPAPAL